jgi:hypothetical protein
MIEAARDGFQKAAGQTDDPVEKESLKNFEDAASQVWTAVQKGRVADKASSPEKRADLRSAASADLVVAMGTLSQADAGRAAAEAKVE